MGRKQYAVLQRIENDHQITRETDREFLYDLENALLLALLEDGTLTQMQYRQASEKLKRQRRNQKNNLPLPLGEVAAQRADGEGNHNL